jgi:hypothetical protein
MNQPLEVTFTNAAQAHRRGDDVTFSVAVSQCENCGRTGERLTHVPEFDYMGCDDCMEEALAVIAREQAERKPAKYEPMQGVLFGSQEVA